jgi:hypothetical protein
LQLHALTQLTLRGERTDLDRGGIHGYRHGSVAALSPMYQVRPGAGS